jgi:hypothetical protein
LSRENSGVGCRRRPDSAEGNIAHGVIRESWVDPARSETLCTYGIFMRENREIPRSPALLLRAGREGKAQAVIP